MSPRPPPKRQRPAPKGRPLRVIAGETVAVQAASFFSEAMSMTKR